jgi:glycosyltransferase involved in cell wall biosynthesis
VASGDRFPDGPPRIAVVFQGEATSPAAWSGIPAGLSSGLAAAGAEVVPIDARLPGTPLLARALRMSWAEVVASDRFAAAGGYVAERALRRAAVDGAVVLGSGFAISPALPTVSFDDMTVAQAMRTDDPEYRSLDAAAEGRWVARQRLIYERSRACCVTSDWVERSVREDYGIAPERIHVVGLGRNVGGGEGAERDWDTPHFLFAGFDWKRKRGDDVVAAFATLRAQHPSATLDLVGNHPPIDVEGVTGHGPLRLDSEAEQREYARLLREATCFVLPSEYEPFGIAYIDAGAAGVPSIGTTVGGTAVSVGPGGVLIDPGDEEALTAAMLELSAPETARRLGALALEHSALFSWRAVAERVLKALRPRGLDPLQMRDFIHPSQQNGL